MTAAITALALVATLSSGRVAPGPSVAVQETGSAAHSTEPSGADTIRGSVTPGQKVRVTDDRGREWQGRIGTFAPEHLVLLTGDRQRRMSRTRRS